MKQHTLISTTAVLVLGLTACGLTAQSPQSGGNIAARFEGVVVTEAELQEAAKADIEEIDTRKAQFEVNDARERHAAIERRMLEIVDNRLIEAQARKQGVTREQLLKVEVTDRVRQPTPEEIDAFYEQNKNRIRGDKEQALSQVAIFLGNNRRGEAYDAYMARLRDEYKVEFLLQPQRSEVGASGFPSRGPDNAPVTIVEFSDFECPFCKSLYTTMKDVETRYAGKVRVVFRQFPLTSIHPNAFKAAEASLCANDQQKFWEMHDSIFDNPRDMSVEALKKRAADLKLNTEAFNGCLDSGQHASAVQKDLIEGTRLGVSGTPAMFVNGRFLSGAQPLEEIAKLIDDELRRK